MVCTSQNHRKQYNMTNGKSKQCQNIRSGRTLQSFPYVGGHLGFRHFGPFSRPLKKWNPFFFLIFMIFCVRIKWKNNFNRQNARKCYMWHMSLQYIEEEIMGWDWKAFCQIINWMWALFYVVIGSIRDVSDRSSGLRAFLNRTHLVAFVVVASGTLYNLHISSSG